MIETLLSDDPRNYERQNVAFFITDAMSGAEAGRQLAVIAPLDKSENARLFNEAMEAYTNGRATEQQIALVGYVQRLAEISGSRYDKLSD